MQPNEVLNNPKQYPVKRKKKSCLGWCGCISVLLVLLLITALVSAVIVSEYIAWRDVFEREKQEHLVINEQTYSDEIFDSVVVKAKNFAESDERIDFIVLNSEEVSNLIFRNLSDTLPESFNVDEVVVIPYDSEWDLYVKLQYLGVKMPWLMVSISDEGKESPIVNVDEIRVGMISIKRGRFLKIVDSVNIGYLEGIDFLSDNFLTSRRLLNVELERTGMIIKGEKIDL